MKIMESETTELKKSTSELKEAIISITSILNKHPSGEIYFGIKNDGGVIGQQFSGKTIRNISKSISDHIEPKIFPEIQEICTNNKKCIRIRFSGTDSPYYAYGRPYIRVGDEDRQLSAKELENIILEKNMHRMQWDNEPHKNATVKDISTIKLKKFLKKAGLKYTSTYTSLEKLGLLKGKKLRNASLALFAKKPERFFSNTSLQCAVFATETTSVIIDRQEFTGDLFQLIDKAEEYILKNTHIGMKISGLRRIDIPEINQEAFREAIINAFYHRDYRENGGVSIAVFMDRLEIRSPGGLYGGLTIEKIREEMVSRRRNELLADMFRNVHYVEKWGRGISLMLSKEPKTRFKEVANTFITIFPRKHAAKTRVKTRIKTRVNAKEKIIALMEKHPSITRKELAQRMGLTIKGIDWNIKNLKGGGILKRIGSRKIGHWHVIKRKSKQSTKSKTPPKKKIPR
ncbi:MAG: putative DNA binding domain-containing protein [DPANN group archaeon]|nr:putative DNA binding domain-containing protein [DPANN group archaeon]